MNERLGGVDFGLQTTPIEKAECNATTFTRASHSRPTGRGGQGMALSFLAGFTRTAWRLYI